MSKRRTAGQGSIKFPDGIGVGVTTVIESTPEEAAEASARFIRKVKSVHVQLAALRLLVLSPVLFVSVGFICFLIGLAIGSP